MIARVREVKKRDLVPDGHADGITGLSSEEGHGANTRAMTGNNTSMYCNIYRNIESFRLPVVCVCA